MASTPPEEYDQAVAESVSAFKELLAEARAADDWGQLPQKCHAYPFTSQRNSITAPLQPSYDRFLRKN